MAVSALTALLVAAAARAQQPSPLPNLPSQPIHVEATVSGSGQVLHFSRAPVVNAHGPATTEGGIRQAQDTRLKYNKAAAVESEDQDIDYMIRTELPGLQRLTRRESEKEFFERISQFARQSSGAERVTFPEETPLTKEVYVPRPLSAQRFPPAVKLVEPAYVVHGRLTFEQPNFERLGYDFGYLQPFVSGGVFCFDMFTLPYQYCKRPCEQLETSAGKPLPGDMAPMVLDPPEISLTGLLGETMVGTGIVLGFPGLFH
jgi:hypothetical protein